MPGPHKIHSKLSETAETKLSSNLLQYYHLSMNHLDNYTHQRESDPLVHPRTINPLTHILSYDVLLHPKCPESP